MTEDEAIAAFRADLDALLRKWGAYLYLCEEPEIAASVIIRNPDGSIVAVDIPLGDVVEPEAHR